MAAPRRPGRARYQLPTCYHEGFLEKKSLKDKMGRKLWTSLCGNALFFFNNTKDNAYIDKLDLSNLISVTDDLIRDRNLDAARFTLHMKNEDIKMIAPTLESRELWKGLILSVAKLSVPASLNLLPGQIHMMKEIIEKEIKRRQSSSSPDANLYVPVVSDMPACYYNISRTEAELRLERYLERGNLLLRPRQDGASYALTTREDVNGSVFKHYRVFRRHEGGFTIDIDTPISCPTLHDIITCMLEKTNGVFKPFLMEEQYEDTITFIEANEENGERSVCRATHSPFPSPPAPPLKPSFVEVHEENGERSVCHATNSPLPSPPAPPFKPSFVEAHEENGERIVCCATNSPFPSPLAPPFKPSFVEAHEENGERSVCPPAPPPKPSKRDHRADSDTPENIYLNDPGLSYAESNDGVDGICVVPHVMPRPPVHLPHQNSLPSLINMCSGVEKIALKPPGYPNHIPRSQSISDLFENKSHPHNELQPAGLTEELKMFLKNRRAMQE